MSSISSQQPAQIAAAHLPESWNAKYGARHRLERVDTLPPGIAAPQRVRLYRRRDHFILQWWDPAAKRTISERVDGDLVAAMSRARQIDERLGAFRTGGHGRRRVTHAALVDQFVSDLGRRANAGEIEPATVNRYGSALAHYLAFTALANISRNYPFAERVDREFQLGFCEFLTSRRIDRETAAQTGRRLMRGLSMALDTTRAMFEWAADPQRGALMPEGFHNPFRRHPGRRSMPAAGGLGDADITIAMATDFLAACDDYQLPLMALILFGGLRAAEPCYLFREHLRDGWVRVECLPALAYTTKGRRDKRVPLPGCLRTLLLAGMPTDRRGLLFVRRRVHEGSANLQFAGTTVDEFVREFERRCARASTLDAHRRQRLRDQLLHDAGGLNYDEIQHEFQKVARKLAWPATATLKDFRHLFATSLENGGVPESYRRYLMGHAPGTAVISRYTHLNKLQEHYQAAVTRELSSVVEVLQERIASGTH